ncbi:MAG: deoxyribodipyrimidine photo-lyase [Candidatus Sericytochromatia bacterium]|nr:deoxyribodipyrimidine photo-lyase [Candidatus Sericytochromatia bacterium]
MNISVFWFRRDLRLNDNTGLYQALSEEKNVLPLFIFDQQILDKLDDKFDKRVDFIHQTIKSIKDKLEKDGSSLIVKYGQPEKIFQELINEYKINAVYTNHDYEPYAIDRDNKIKLLLAEKNIKFNTFKDQVIFEKDEVLSQTNKPYTVYTPYKNKWREKFYNTIIKEYPSEERMDKFIKIKPLPFVELKDMGFNETNTKFPSTQLNEEIVKEYDKYRDFPAKENISRMSVHLRFGTVSIRELVKKADKLNQTWLNELIWREFFMTIIYNHPNVVTESFRTEYDKIKWLNNIDDFKKWCEGKTGYPIVDAGMRELNQTGYMHNRVRLVTASFLTKHLLIDWRWGEKYFAKKLLDYELSSNNGNWQWCAGTGCDAAPYFRVFNPQTQTERFDPKMEYIQKWVTEYNTKSYPHPMVEHKFARERALNAFKEALGKS